MINKISKQDRKDWEEFVSKKEKVQDKDLADNSSKERTIRSIDLHGSTLEDANSKIENFINEAFNDNCKKLIVVTGKGLHSTHESDPYISKDLGILKHSVPNFIRNNKNLMRKIIEIKGADIKDGGDGAIYIILKKNNK